VARYGSILLPWKDPWPVATVFATREDGEPVGAVDGVLRPASCARGHDHAHSVRILARAWLFVIWHCWQDHVAHDPAQHGALQRCSNKITNMRLDTGLLTGSLLPGLPQPVDSAPRVFPCRRKGASCDASDIPLCRVVWRVQIDGAGPGLPLTAVGL
jgi:hypothetical protein